jgi:hypothetical protein
MCESILNFLTQFQMELLKGNTWILNGTKAIKYGKSTKKKFKEWMQNFSKVGWC